MAITDYSTTMTASIAGQLADLGVADIRSFFNEEASAEIPFGYAVVQGTAEKGALLPSTSDDAFVGIVAHSHAYDPTTSGPRASRRTASSTSSTRAASGSWSARPWPSATAATSTT
jgi:hypothetical protein